MIPGINERLLTTKNDSAPALWITFRLRGAQEDVLQEEAGTAPDSQSNFSNSLRIAEAVAGDTWGRYG